MNRLIRQTITTWLAWRSRRALARSIPGWREADAAPAQTV